MENPKIAWTQERVAKAAESAASFVELLSQEDFFRLGLIKWLRPSDLKKFRDWLAADDARKLKELSGRWFYKKDASNTRGMPLPDELHEHSDGIPLLCRIAEFEPDWIAEWCIWKIQKSKYEFVTDRACEQILSVTGDLAGHGIHKHSIQILDAVFEGRDDETASKYLDTLSAAWKGPVGSDPISQGIKHSHCRLDKVLRAPWNSCANPSGDKWKAWDDEFHWHAGKRNTLKGIACAPAPSFQLELGFSCGWRMAKNGIEPSASSLDAMFQELGIPNSPALAAEVSVLPMAKLWAILYMLSEYGGRYRSHSTEFVGLRQEVAQLVTVNPS